MLDKVIFYYRAHRNLCLGAITVAVIMITVASVVVFGRIPIGKKRYAAEFAQAAQLQPGDRATIAGITVGNVASVKLAGDRVLVTFLVRNDLHLGAQTQAAIKLTTILGSRYLELRPAGDSELRDNRIPLSNTTVPYDLQRTLQDSTTTFDQIDAERVTESRTLMAQELSGLPDALPQALANIRSLSDVVAERRDQIGTLLRSTDTVTSLIRNQRADIAGLVIQGRELLSEITSRRQAFERLLSNATRLADRVHAILDDEPQIDALLKSVHELAGLISKNDPLIRNILQAMPVTVRNVTNAFGTSNAVDVNDPAGPFIDSWMCAISGRAKQFGLTEYFEDCEPVPDPWPGWPPPQPERVP